MQKVLVVDDDEAIIHLFEDALKDRYTVITACDGREAIKRVSENIPDLIILDIHLPHLNGFDTCKLLKEDEKTKAIPVIMMTGSRDPEVRERCLGLGAKGFVEKPFSIIEFLNYVEGLLD